MSAMATSCVRHQTHPSATIHFGDAHAVSFLAAAHVSLLGRAAPLDLTSQVRYNCGDKDACMTSLDQYGCSDYDMVSTAGNDDVT